MSVSLGSTIKAARLFQPVAGVVPSGFVTVGAYSGSPQSYTDLTTIMWDSGLLTAQGQQWEAVNLSDSTQGVRNAASPRTSGGVHLSAVTEVEFLFTGGQCDIVFIGTSYYDAQVYVEYGGRTYKTSVLPVAGTTSGPRHIPIQFAAQYHGRIRVHVGGGVFVGVKCEQSAIIKPSPLRPFGIADGGSGADGVGVHQAPGTSFLTGGLCDYLFERTGIVWARRGQPDTGFFHNSNAAVTTDTAATDGSTRWFSQSRKDWMTGSGPSGVSDFAGKPLFYLLDGTRQDGGNSGATGLSTGPMAVRELSCLQWIRQQDPLCTIAHVSPSPFTGAGAAGSATGPPTAGNPHDLNRQEHQFAIGKVPRAAYINSFGPTVPWFTGTGSAGSPNSSQQAVLIGADGVHMTSYGYEFYAARIAAELGQLPINTARARGQW